VKILTCPQRSPEWHQARCGLLTGTCAEAILKVRKRGAGELEIRRQLRQRLVAERLTGRPCDELAHKPDYMQRGEDLEAEAFAAYEALTGQVVARVGFVLHDTLDAGCSPDGYVGDWDGVIELKCPKSTTHLDYLQAGIIPPEYRGQIVHTLWNTGAQWCDFVSYDNRFLDERLELFVARAYRDEQVMASYELLATQFLAEVAEDVQRVKSIRAVNGAAA
jgi:hypothetical protein